ncbi:pyroglutamylated RF-amide peptide receptor-like [Paramacrobiotus metropolitanus]|uniref:pyroglutamylated RF-amide peptide receptor-like n=1 Tax=Paramacrobiotus metropolitanus TaxID=2943436 RepID=UPI002445EB6B|nr:pyroglutamylated RF-amide peptide receptor-like [Paramacrobiotus metropolitanus]
MGEVYWNISSSNLTQIYGSLTLPAQLTGIVGTASLLLNAALLSLFLLKRNLWTPFDLYFLALVSNNVLLHGIATPLTVMLELDDGWPVNIAGCLVYAYAVFILLLNQLAIHSCIAINRIWAMVAPVSFRNFHTFRSAGCLAVAIVVVSHVVGLPLILVDILQRQPVQLGHCFFGDPNYSLVEQVSTMINRILLFACFMIMVISMPVIVWKRWQRLRLKHQIVLRPNAKKRFVPNADITRAREGQSAILIIAFGASIVVCWGPYVTYYVVASGYDLQIVQYLVVLFNCQSVADPIILVCALPVWRNALHEAVCRYNRAKK